MKLFHEHMFYYLKPIIVVVIYTCSGRHVNVVLCTKGDTYSKLPQYATVNGGFHLGMKSY